MSNRLELVHTQGIPGQMLTGQKRIMLRRYGQQPRQNTDIMSHDVSPCEEINSSVRAQWLPIQRNIRDGR